MEAGRKKEKLTDLLWCDHLHLTPQPLMNTDVVHAYLHGQKAYIIIIEQLKVKVICPKCWMQ
jgi:hypothetical protein